MQIQSGETNTIYQTQIDYKTMNNIEKIYKKHQDISSFAGAYFLYVSKLLQKLNLDGISIFMSILDEARLNKNTIFIIGNGGSASTASHIGTDFGAIMLKKCTKDLPFRVVSLTDHVPTMTMIGNDFGYEHIFTKQLEVQYREGDVLVVVSASGNSSNIIEAANWVHARNGKVLGLLGFDGGKLKGVCDSCIIVNTPKGEYGPVEDIHLILNHMFISWIQLKFADK